MLAPRYLAGLSDEIVEIYAQLENDILSDMARRIAKLGRRTAATDWQAQLLAETGALKKDINKYIKKYDPAIQKEITAIYNDAMVKNARADNRIFKEALGHGVSNTNAQVMLANIQKTHSDLSRLTITTALTSERTFIQQANAAYMQVVTGAFDYDTAMKNAVNKMAAEGLRGVHYNNGRPVTLSIENAVRINILTGVNQTAAAMTLNNCDELEVDLVEVTAHIGARPTHEAWQGKVYSRSGLNKNYPPFSICELGEIDGICGINCKHSFYPYFEGYGQHYTQKDLDEMTDATVNYNGKKMSRYEGEQELRKMERNIRLYKRRAVTEEAAGIDNTASRRKIGEWQSKAADFTQKTGIARDRAREYIGTPDGIQPRALPPKPPAPAPTPAAQPRTAADMNAKAGEFYKATRNLNTFVTKAETTQTMTALQQTTIVQGKNLAGQLRVKVHEKDINDVLSAQGFDGLPTVLRKDDFIKAVNNDTFIAQRTYTAGSKAELDAYIEMLRTGDFYVDCRTGGRAHGKGMYAAADYSKGKDLTRIINEMDHYQRLGLAARGERYTMIETLCIDPSARIINEADVIPEFIKSYSQYMKGQGFTSKQISDKITKEGWLSRDPGVLAAIMGYDAIRAVQSVNRADYMVILNRTKLILLGA